MWQLLIENPWLVPACLGLLIPISGIVFGTVTSYLQKTRQAELDAGLKHEMLQRGMSAEEIVQVIRARPGRFKHEAVEEPRERPESHFERR
jgi:hypothetical protein